MKYPIILFVILLSGALIAAGCTQEDDHGHDEMTAEEMEQHVMETHTDEQGNIVYTCPMHPEVRESEPVNCPICGMNLVAVHLPDTTEVEHSHSEQDTSAESQQSSLPITPVQQQLIGMQYDTVTTRPLTNSFRTVGFLTHAEPNLTDIVPRFNGYIEEVHVAETGVHVMKDQPLITVYSPELLSSQEDYLIALKRQDDNLARRARERLRLLLMPESEIKKLEEKGEPLLRVTLTSPVRGHIMQLNVRKGMEFSAETLLYRLNNHSELWLQAEIYEDDLPYVSIGQQVNFEIQGQPGRNYTGTVSFIPPMINSSTRTIPVRIEVPNPDFSLKMNQYAWVNFHHDLGEKLTVHRDAVLKTGTGDVVFIETGRGQFQPVDVELGPLTGTYYEVLNGLQSGDRVVTGGRFWLDAESRLRGTGGHSSMNMDMNMN